MTRPTKETCARVAAAARDVLQRNRLRGVSNWEGRRYDFVCPSRETYPFQWLWDSSFHAIALLHVDPQLAKQELSCFLDNAPRPDGQIGHMILWDDRYHDLAARNYMIRLASPFLTASTQPPVLARAALRVFEATGDAAWLGSILPPITRHLDWLSAVRDPDGDGLVSVVQPDETLDASPKHDDVLGVSRSDAAATQATLNAAMRRIFGAYAGVEETRLVSLNVFANEDVMFNSIYADALTCAAEMARALGDPSLHTSLLDRAGHVTDALLRKCWDTDRGVFWDLFGIDEKPLTELTCTSLFPIILRGLPSAIVSRVVRDHIMNVDEFWLPFPIPSVAASEPSFDPGWRVRGDRTEADPSQTTWRGPTWVNINWYLHGGLRLHGYFDIASELASRTVEMIAKAGVREFFDPRDATGQGAQSFGWSCLVLDLMATEGWLEPQDRSTT